MVKSQKRSEKPKTEPGIYRLNQEVENPKPDGRKRGDWRFSKTFKPGTFVVGVHDWGFKDRPALMISIKPLRGPDRWSLETQECTAAILPHLTKEDDLEAQLSYAEKEHYVNMREVLLRLVRSGTLAEQSVLVAVSAEREKIDIE